jgi:hypothetical protein
MDAMLQPQTPVTASFVAHVALEDMKILLAARASSL